MIGQYLSTRLSSRSGSEFGRVAMTDGISPEIANRLDQYAAAYGIDKTDNNGQRVPLMMKFALDKEGSFAIGLNSFVASKKPTHFAHQYVFTGDSTLDLVTSPDEIFRLPFVDDNQGYDVQAEISISSTSAVEKSLKKTLDMWGLTKSDFADLLSAVYDCTAAGRKILFVLDTTFYDDIAKCSSILYHLFRFLPYQMRMCLGFDSCYSYITSKNHIHISFITPDMLSLSSEGEMMIGDRHVSNDYIVKDGQIIHTGNTVSNSILQSGMQKYIDAEYSGENCESEMSEVFDAIYSLAQGTPFGFYDKLSVYDAMFAAMSVVAGNAITRAQSEPLMSFYLAAHSKLDERSLAFWDNAVYTYLCDCETDTNDSYIATVLAKICCVGAEVNEYAMPMLQNKLAQAIESEGDGAAKRFDAAIAMADPDRLNYLARRVFSYTPESERAFISYKLSTATNAGEVCALAAETYHIIGLGNPQLSTDSEISSVAAQKIGEYDITTDDIEAMKRISMAEQSDEIRSVIHILIDDALDIMQLENMEPSWFLSLRFNSDYMPYTAGGVTAALVRDILLDSSSDDLQKYLLGYSYVPSDDLPESVNAALNILYTMFTDGRLELTKEYFSLLLMLTKVAKGFDFDEINAVLSLYPDEIAGFTDVIGKAILKSQDADSTTDLFTQYLKAIEPICTDDLADVDVKEVILAVNTQRKQGIKCDYAREFNKTIYDACIERKGGINKLMLKLGRRNNLLSNSQSRASRPWYAAFFAVFALGIGLAIFFLTDSGRQPVKDINVNVYSGGRELQVVAYNQSQTLSTERIRLAEQLPNQGLTLDLPITFAISGSDVRYVEYTQKNLQNGSTVYTIGDVNNIKGNGSGEYTLKLTNINDELQRVFVCIEVKLTDGNSLYYGISLED